MQRLLIAEDDGDFRESLAECLRDQGFDVTEARNGDEALGRLRAESYSLVLLDLVMPEMTGDEVFARIQADPELCATPVLIMTSDPSRAPGGALVMSKPINLHQLLRLVRQMAVA